MKRKSGVPSDGSPTLAAQRIGGAFTQRREFPRQEANDATEEQVPNRSGHGKKLVHLRISGVRSLPLRCLYATHGHLVKAQDN